MINNKRLILGVSGGIAAYKSAFLARLLVKNGADVHVVMTPNATQFISPITFQALTNNYVWVNETDNLAFNNMAHINLTRTADSIIIAPATANSIAKFSCGIGDNLLCNMMLARPKNLPVFIAPAMNVEMWENLATQRNITQLINDGVNIISPTQGEQACGEIGYGRMSEPQEIIEHLINYFTHKILQGKNIVITAGATREYIDPVRYISNASSGKMGFALAYEAKNMGANVTLITGNTHLVAPKNIQVIQVENAQQMYIEVMNIYSKNDSSFINKTKDIFISVAAVADWTPNKIHEHKLKKHKNIDKLTLELIKTPDILSNVANLKKSPLCIGFAAETQNLIEYAKYKVIHKNLDIIVANLMQDGFAHDTNKVFLLNKFETQIKELNILPKNQVAQEILNYISQVLLKHLLPDKSI